MLDLPDRVSIRFRDAWPQVDGDSHALLPLQLLLEEVGVADLESLRLLFQLSEFTPFFPDDGLCSTGFHAAVLGGLRDGLLAV